VRQVGEVLVESRTSQSQCDDGHEGAHLRAIEQGELLLSHEANRLSIDAVTELGDQLIRDVSLAGLPGPFAVGVAISPVPIIAVILMLLSQVRE
jgi:hypothetical protein